MPGGKGPSSSGNVTQTVVNPTQQAQAPFLTTGFQHAQDLYDNNPFQYYPGTTLADLSGVGQGYSNLYNTGVSVDQTLRPAANSIFFNAANGGMSVGNSPAFSTYASLANDITQPQLDLHNLGSFLDTNPVPGQIAGGANQGQQDLLTQGASLSDVARQATANPYVTNMADLGFQGSGATANFDPALSSISNAEEGNPYAGQLGGMASGPIAGLDASGRPLAAEANGAFLTNNPYIEAEYNAATRPMVRNYETAVIPEIDSRAESGRYGSGWHQAMIDTAEQDLAKGLGDTAANLYGQDYANERGLMQQAQGTLGNLALGAFGARTGALANAGNLNLADLSAAAGASTSAAQIAQNELGLRSGILGNAGSLYNTGIGNAVGARQAAAMTDQNYINSILSGVQAEQAGQMDAGQLTEAQLGGMQSGATGLQTGYDTGNRNSLIGLGEEPSVLAGNFMPVSQELQAATGLSSIQQQQLNDAINRFYGNQQAPWQQLAAYMNLIGNPVGGSSSTTTPILGPSPFSSALGTLGSIGSLGNQFGLFGSGGLLGGAGLGSALTGSLATAAPAGSMFAALGGLGADTAGAALGGGLAEALPFLAL